MHDQIDTVRRKYERRIERFYQSVCEPTLFIRHVWHEEELKTINDHYDEILSMLRTYHPDNNILLIADFPIDGYQIPNLYYTEGERKDGSVEHPLQDHPLLKEILGNADFVGKEKNLQFVQEKARKKQHPTWVARFKKKKTTLLKKYGIIKNYHHDKQYS